MNLTLVDHEELVNLLTAGGLYNNRKEAFDFFRKNLLRMCGEELAKPNPRFDNRQLNYVADVLTIFSVKAIQVGSWPLPDNSSEDLRSLEKRFSIPNLPLPAWRHERLGRLLLFMASFEEQLLKRYYTEYYISLAGERLFLKAAIKPKTELLLGISKNFVIWLNYLRALKYQFIRGDKVFKPLILTLYNPE